MKYRVSVHSRFIEIQFAKQTTKLTKLPNLLPSVIVNDMQLPSKVNLVNFVNMFDKIELRPMQ